MAKFYKHDIAAWMDGTESLDDGCYRVYHIVCQLIYSNDGPIRLHEQGIAGRCNQHVLRFRKNLAYLVHAGLLNFADGKLYNARAAAELGRMQTKHQPRLTPPTTLALPPPDPETTSTQQGGGSPEGKRSKPLKNNNPPPRQGLLDEMRGDERREERKAGPVGPVDLEKQYFDRAVQVLGSKNARTVAGSLLKACGKNIAQARAKLEEAVGRSKADQFIWGQIKYLNKKSSEPLDDTVMMNNADDSRVLM